MQEKEEIEEEGTEEEEEEMDEDDEFEGEEGEENSEEDDEEVEEDEEVDIDHDKQEKKRREDVVDDLFYDSFNLMVGHYHPLRIEGSNEAEAFEKLINEQSTRAAQLLYQR